MIPVGLILTLLICQSPGTTSPELLEGVLIQAGGEKIAVRAGHLAPDVVDWNNDGKKDLILGQRSGGRIRLYINEGTDDQPRFDRFEYLTAGGATIALESG
jgi:hypothetical protein